MGRTSSISPSSTTPIPPASATTAVSSPDGAQTTAEKTSNNRDAENDFTLMQSQESLADKVRDAASTAASTVAQATSAPAHESSVAGGGGSRVEGRWEQETFVLPLPDGDEEFLTNGAGDEESNDDNDDNVDEQGNIGVPNLLGRAAQDNGDEHRNETAGGESSSISVDDGVHLRVEVWQGEHCHGQVNGAF